MENSMNFITSVPSYYEIDGDEIVIYHSFRGPIRLKYTEELEKECLEIMRKDAITRANYADIYSSRASTSLTHTIGQGALAALNASLLLLSTNGYVKGFNIFAALYCGTFAAVFANEHAKAKEIANEIKKYNLFFDWEEEINEDVFKRYHELYGEDAPIEEANKITINDIKNRSFTEVQETVENISKSKKLSLKR